MKKFKTILTAIVMLFALSSFATEPEKVTQVVKTAFEEDFSKATQVNWKKSNDFYFASFMLNNERVDAAYNEEGELLGTSRNITSEQMPLSVSMAIAEKYKGYKLANSAIELTFAGQTRYYITIGDNKQVLNLKCFSNGDIEVESKSKS